MYRYIVDIYVQPNLFTVHLKLTHYKSIILQSKKRMQGQHTAYPSYYFVLPHRILWTLSLILIVVVSSICRLLLCPLSCNEDNVSCHSSRLGFARGQNKQFSEIHTNV